MADALSVIPANVLHNLSDKLYEKRKNAALEHGRKEINVEVKKEAEYFGDIFIVPYMDNYDLVVLKTVAICEYGCRNVIVLAAANITELEEEWGCLIELTKSCGLLEVVEPYVSKWKLLIVSFKGKLQEVSRIESAIEALRKKLPPGTLSKTK